MQPTAEEL